MSNAAYPDIDTAGLCTSCSRPRAVGDWPACPHERGGGGLLIASIHTSERAVVYMNLKTGERRIPGRADQPMPAVYQRQGYERVELDTHQKRRDFEKKTGLVQESAHYDKGGAGAEKSLLTGQETPKISGLDQAYGDRQLLTRADFGRT